MIDCMVRRRPQEQAQRTEWAHWVSSRVESADSAQVTCRFLLPSLCDTACGVPAPANAGPRPEAFALGPN
eukprot:15455624-Alexandrium_andersonii.AAC.1